MPSQVPVQAKLLGLSPEALRSEEASLSLYEAAMRPRRPTLLQAAKGLWTFAGIVGLMVLAWSEPWSAALFSAARSWGAPSWLFECLAVPLVMALRAVLLVESFGYAYHRFFQHVGYFTRRSQVFRRNQRYHWIHHMIIYPVGRYVREMPFVPSEPGIAWSWVVPAVLTIALAFWSMGAGLGTWVFVIAIAAYAKLVVDKVHSRFHEASHPWQGSPYFQWLEKIHLLHHWDHRTNFTIVHPLMDVLFGTYLSPRRHRRELKVALADRELTVSDLINWRYLLTEATPAEYAAFICAARQHPRSLRKVGHLMEVLRHRINGFPEDEEARDLREKAARLVDLLRS